MHATALLLVEDDPNVARTLVERLGAEGFAVTHAGSVAAAREALEKQPFAAAVLDVGLPDGNGFEVGRHLREVSPATAMLFLTAWGSPEDRIRGLELGADDYMTKPFAFRELVLRIHNMLKRAGEIAARGTHAAGPVRIGIASVDFERFTAESGGVQHRLTHKECAVLKLLLERAGRAVSRDEILARAWALDEFPTERTVDNFILRLRRLVERDPANPATIRSIRGVGYQLENMSTETTLTAALNRRNTGRPPVWMMRQAGRYHSHYQMLKRHNDFLALCKQPELAAEVALGPVHEFNFDAAILFSDLLFPLEAMGMGLTYDPGPKLAFHVKTPDDVARLGGGADKAQFMDFQAGAMQLTRARLRADKGLIGFVGGPWTLYVYAAAGSHERAKDALGGLGNGVYQAFNDKLLDLLAANMALQSAAGAENIALFDTAAGEIDAASYGRHVVPVLADLLARFRKLDAHTPVTYYSRGTGPAYWDQLQDLPFQCLGIDWRHDLAEVLENYGERWCIQGNVDPEWLHLPYGELEQRLSAWFTRLKALPADLRRGWICGLGHGVLQRTPEVNVRRFVSLQREILGVNSLPPELLARHGGPGPRYTSYPTVTHWGAAPSAAQWLAWLAQALSPATARASLYVHIPFCQSLCTFCGCNMRLVRNHALAAPYVETLLKEYALYRGALGTATLTLGELHLGGGSPTYLPAGALDRLLDGLLRDARRADDADFAIEADPRNTTREQLEVLRRHGFNALSIGVQDFDARVLEIVNRGQTEEQVRGLVDTARTLGIDNISFDLIYGLPLQTTDSLAETFDVVARLRPERISFLPYAHVPWIKPSQRRYTEADLPDTAQRHGLFLLGRERMSGMGYVEIGFDQYALPGDPLVVALDAGRLSRNFMGFSASHTDALIGLGVSAIGDAHAAYAQNEKNLQQYETRLAAGELPLQRGHALSEEDRGIRALLWTLFAGGAAALDEVQGTAWWRAAQPALATLRNDGLVELDARQISVTQTGRAFLRRLGLAFDPQWAHAATG